MFKHNFLTIFRNFKRNKLTFFINLIGLSTGLACTLLIYLWVNSELCMDKFHEKESQLYQVLLNFHTPQGTITMKNTAAPLARALEEEMPEVESSVAVNDFFNWNGGDGILTYKDKSLKAIGLLADKEFFDVFSYPLSQGDKNQALIDKKSIVISEDLAKKIFNTNDDIIGKSLRWSHRGFGGTFQISGILAPLPSTSTMQFDVIFNIKMLLENDIYAPRWENSYVQTYLILKKETNINRFNEKISDFLKLKNPLNENFTIFAQQYSQKYLYSHYENGIPVGGRISYIRLFSLIALFILLIACINFINLSTAEASKKMKEIGIKKTIGVDRNTIIMHYLGEAMLMAFISLGFAIILVELLIPQFNIITGKNLNLTLSINLLLIFLGITIFTGLLSGLYPALYLSGFNPVTVLKGKLDAFFGEIWLRKGLVIFQFTLSILFIIGLFVINKQIEFTQTKNLGYNQDNILCFQWKGEYDWLDKSNYDLDAFMFELKQVPGVINVTSMSGNILTNIYGQSNISWRGQESDREYAFKSPVVGYDFIETLGLEIIAGRSFSRDYNDDYSKIILNEAAEKMMGFEDPVGKSISMNGTSHIIGVIRNFHYGSLHEKIEPMIFRFLKYNQTIMVKMKSGSERITIENLEKIYKKFHPGYPFEFTFLDEEYQALYESEMKVAALSKYFAGIAIIISCLGLFGLAAFTAQKRQKEIGIRKVLGANIFGIMYLLSNDFTKLVSAAMAIAFPLSYILTTNWLGRFAYRIELNVWYFISAGIMTLVIAWITVGMQTFKAARINPAICLKNE